jgi:hypothetical protein
LWFFLFFREEVDMKSYYSAYLAYENRVIRGEMEGNTGMITKHPPLRVSPLSMLADLLIRAGLKLKRQQAAGKPMTWSPLTGSKP